jgi:hypothetical protein
MTTITQPTGRQNTEASLLRIEFWGVTTLFVFVLFFFVTSSLDGNSALINAPYSSRFTEAHMPFYYYKNYFVPVLSELVLGFLVFWTLNFYIVPRLIRKEALVKNTCLLLLAFIVLAIVDGVTDTYIHAYLYANNGRDATDQSIFRQSFLSTLVPFAVFGVYTLLKYTSLYLLSSAKEIQRKYRFIHPSVVSAFVIWLFVLFFTLVFGGERAFITIVSVTGFVGILMYTYSLYAGIPKRLPKTHAFVRYMAAVVLWQILLLFPVFFLSVVGTGSEDIASVVTAFNFMFQLFVTAPLSWVLFKRQLKGNEEIYVLEKALGQSHARLDFLRSQINPHFLFNALNTIYGTALQENAERTGEVVQRLGDMMRFMLQENLQDTIPLSREVDYLNNYISLQKLRTDPNPNIVIDTSICEELYMVQIAPMLLIPFVENAFKHGISFRETSSIKISLEVKDKMLYFDVSNSRHAGHPNDPEKDKTGIGLNNVKQRLQLLYKNKHELLIRETANDFYVHLSLQLS